MKTLLISAMVLLGAVVLVTGYPAVGLCEEGVVETHSFNREACIDDCKSRFGIGWPHTFGLQFRGGHPDYGTWRAIQRMYFRCVQSCEKRFWDDFDKEMDDLEDELDR
jgi:hypothetical protein